MTQTPENTAPPPPPPPESHPSPQPAKSNTHTVVLIIVACVAGVVLVCGGILAGIMLPAIKHTREMAHRARETATLNSIVQSMQAYAATYDDQFPPHPGLLIEDGFVNADVFDSVATDAEPNVSYSGQIPPVNTNCQFGEHYFVYNWREGPYTALDQPIAFGPSFDGEGRAVAFGDGRAEFMTTADFEQMIRRANDQRRADPNLGPVIDLNALGAQ